MRAMVIDRFGGPEEIHLADVEKPSPAPGEILVKNEYVGVGKPDFIMRSGICPFLDKFPPNLTVGNECSGIIEAIGENVNGFEIGQKVVVNSGLGYGAYADYISVPAQFVTILPDTFPTQYAPGILNYMVAYALINEVGKGTDGKSIYISGAAGGVGTAVIQTAKLYGIKVIASGSTKEKCDYIRKVGADCVFNHTKENAKDVILNFTDGKGVDIIYDQYVGKDFNNQFEYLADFGMIVIYNWLKGDPELDQLGTIIGRSSHAQAVRSFSFHVYDNNPEKLQNIRKICIENIMSGKITPILFDTLPLEEAAHAHELLDGQKIMGKLILKV